MEITNELLAAYTEGNISDSERDSVRQYLADHPEELESVMMMMDEDYDIDLETETEVEDVAPTCSEGTFSDICYSAAAFAPRLVPLNNNIESPGHDDIGNFNQLLGDLLDEIDL